MGCFDHQSYSRKGSGFLGPYKSSYKWVSLSLGLFHPEINGVSLGPYLVPDLFAAVQKMYIIWTENEHATVAKR